MSDSSSASGSRPDQSDSSSASGGRPDQSWEPFELVVVRSTGFPYRWLDGLRDAGLLELADRVRELDATVDDLAGRFLERARKADRPRDTAGFRRARNVVRAARSQRPVPADDGRWAERRVDLPGWTQSWNTTLARRTAAAAALDRRYAACLASARAALAALIADERVREAVFLLTPEILDHGARRFLERPPRSGAPNQDERKLVSYVQRLCAKCETNAFAGPIAYGWTGTSQPAYLASLPGRLRRGFAAFWAVRALVSVVDSDWPRRAPRRGPAADLVQLPAALRGLVDAMDGRTTWIELAASTGRRLPEQRTVERLDRSGIAWTAPQLAASEPDALAAACAAGVGGARGARLGRLRELAGAFAAAGVGGKAQALSAAEALVREAGVEEVRRGAGRLYADRTVLYEEDLDGRRGGPLTQTALEALCAALEPVLDLAAAIAVEAREAAAGHARAAFRQHFPGQRRVGLGRFLRATGLSHPVDLSATPAARRLAGLVAEACDGRAAESWDGGVPEVVLDRATVAGLGQPVEGPLLASPDVLLAAATRADVEAGTFDVVVGEIHWGLQLLGNLCCFVDDRQALLERARTWLAGVEGSEHMVNVALGDRYGKMAFLEVFPRTLELSGAAAGGRAVLHPDDLVVDEAARLWTCAGGQPVLLAIGDPVGAEHTPFAPPALRLPTLRTGAFTPRVRLGTAVVQRATWVLDAAGFERLGDRRGAGRYRACVEVLRSRGVPDRLFARLPGEDKPLHVDLASPHLVDLLLHACRDGEVRLTEMLPGPGDLWLDGEGPLCSELRFAFARLPESGASSHDPTGAMTR